MHENLDQGAPAGHGFATRRPLAVLAIVLLVLGVLFVALYRIKNDDEHHSFNAGAKAPASVEVTAGKFYEISIPGGVNALASAGIAPANITCTYTQVGSGSARTLDVTALGAGTRTVHAIATFVGPVTGAVQLSCAGLPSVFVDDADNGGADPAGLFILLATIAFTLGAAAGLSVLYRRPPRPSAAARPHELDAYYGPMLADGNDQDAGHGDGLRY